MRLPPITVMNSRPAPTISPPASRRLTPTSALDGLTRTTRPHTPWVKHPINHHVAGPKRSAHLGKAGRSHTEPPSAPTLEVTIM